MPFMIGALLLFEEIGYLATIGVCLIGLSAATFGYYGEQFNSNAIKYYKKAKDEKNEKDK
ncbi:MAG: hypothetical protein K0B81_00270 [Candidatus Cloacimonetes bacterium]|nr:hypothetical protein [Candidatus Cloacimonadota bacterium]